MHSVSLSQPPALQYGSAQPWADEAVSPWDTDQCWQRILCRRVVEISCDQATGRMSLAVAFVLGAQHAGETVAWIQWAHGGLYPPDLHASGVDLQALAAIHVPQNDAYGLPRAAEILLRSGGFGLVVLDATGAGGLPKQAAWQGRLLALARAHDSSVLLLTHTSAEADSAGLWVGLRLQPQRQLPENDACRVSVAVLKNKTGLYLPTPSWQRGGPAGLI
jgi:hypothetical protein